jgi:hypothetical protein
MALRKHADSAFGVIAVTSLNHLGWPVLVLGVTRARKRLKHGVAV